MSPDNPKDNPMQDGHEPENPSTERSPHEDEGTDLSPSSSKPLLNRAVQAQLGQRLRVFYESLALGEQPVPDRFIEIIDRLNKVSLDQGQTEKPQ